MESKLQDTVKATREELIKTLGLTYFDQKVDHIIQVDESMKGFGAVLLQKGRPANYVSRMLMPADTSYPNIERELLSIIFRLERSHHCVFGTKVGVQTDHKPLILIWKKSIAAASPQLQ